VHFIQRIESESLPIGLLRKQKLLCDIAEEHRPSLSAAREVCFCPTGHCDFAFCGCVGGTASARGDFVVFIESTLHGAFAANIRAHLHSPHLIQKA
jgi:hypothetical protein